MRPNKHRSRQGDESDEAQEVESPQQRRMQQKQKKQVNGDGKQAFVSTSNYNSQHIDHKDYETDQGEGDQPNVNPKPVAEKQSSGQSKQKRGVKNAKTLDDNVTLPTAQLEIISPSSSKFKLEAQADIAHPPSQKS